MSGHVPLRELQERLSGTRGRVFHDQGMSRTRKLSLWAMILSYALTTLASFALPVQFRWTGLVTLAIEIIAGIVFYLDVSKSEFSENEWLDKYDLLAVEDGLTVEWISAYGKAAIVRSMETLKERTIGEDVAFSLIFGPAGNIGFIAILGVIYTQADTVISSHLTTSSIVIRVFIATVIAITYFTSWGENIKRVRRDRMKLILEFGLARLEAGETPS